MHKSLDGGDTDAVWLSGTRRSAPTAVPAGREFCHFSRIGTCLVKRSRSGCWALSWWRPARVWARKVASIDAVGWVEEIMPHLCRHRYHSPQAGMSIRGRCMARKPCFVAVSPLSMGARFSMAGSSPEEAHEVFVREAVSSGVGLRTRGEFLVRLRRSAC